MAMIMNVANAKYIANLKKRIESERYYCNSAVCCNDVKCIDESQKEDWKHPLTGRLHLSWDSIYESQKEDWKYGVM